MNLTELVEKIGLARERTLRDAQDAQTSDTIAWHENLASRFKDCHLPNEDYATINSSLLSGDGNYMDELSLLLFLTEGRFGTSREQASLARAVATNIFEEASRGILKLDHGEVRYQFGWSLEDFLKIKDPRELPRSNIHIKIRSSDNESINAYVDLVLQTSMQ